tara:strand:+ start:1891 stop:2535 length:645 start_codon:yes stop_codon:yes gene_type:complete
MNICKLNKSGSLQYYIQLLIGSIICGTGFVTNSETTVIGSMLISPIGGLIMKFGKEGFKRKMKETSEGLKKVKNTSKGQLMESKLLAMVVVPIIIGLTCGYFFKQVADTDVVEGRGRTLMDDPRLFVASAVIASSAALLFSWGDKVTMVGIGIATALLPPLVAIGFSFGKYFKGRKNKTDLGLEDTSYSGILFAINFFALYISVIIFNYYKCKD